MVFQLSKLKQVLSRNRSFFSTSKTFFQSTVKRTDVPAEDVPKEKSIEELRQELRIKRNDLAFGVNHPETLKVLERIKELEGSSSEKQVSQISMGNATVK